MDVNCVEKNSQKSNYLYTFTKLTCMCVCVTLLFEHKIIVQTVHILCLYQLLFIFAKYVYFSMIFKLVWFECDALQIFFFWIKFYMNEDVNILSLYGEAIKSMKNEKFKQTLTRVTILLSCVCFFHRYSQIFHFFASHYRTVLMLSLLFTSFYTFYYKCRHRYILILLLEVWKSSQLLCLYESMCKTFHSERVIIIKTTESENIILSAITWFMAQVLPFSFYVKYSNIFNASIVFIQRNGTYDSMNLCECVGWNLYFLVMFNEIKICA